MNLKCVNGLNENLKWKDQFYQTVGVRRVLAAWFWSCWPDRPYWALRRCNRHNSQILACPARENSFQTAIFIFTNRAKGKSYGFIGTCRKMCSVPNFSNPDAARKKLRDASAIFLRKKKTQYE